MAKGNQVSLEFIGDSSSIEKTFSRVGAEAKGMAGDLDKAEGQAKSFGTAMDRAGDAADGSEGKFMGAADLLDGLGGAFGLPTEGATNMMRSFGDLSGGFAKLGPMVGSLGSSLGALATGPVGLIVAGVGILAVTLVKAYQSSETFRDIVSKAFSAVKAVVGPVLDFLSNTVGKVFGFIGGMFKKSSDDADEMADLQKQALERLQDSYDSWADSLTSTLDSMADPFERFNHNQKLSLEEATANLAFNVSEYRKWQEDIDVIHQKYGQSVARYVSDQGPKFHGVADQLANATGRMGQAFAEQVNQMVAVKGEAGRFVTDMVGLFDRLKGPVGSGLLGGGSLNFLVGAGAGNGASGSWGPPVVVNVAGSVTTERQLVDAVVAGINRNSRSGGAIPSVR